MGKAQKGSKKSKKRAAKKKAQKAKLAAAAAADTSESAAVQAAAVYLEQWTQQQQQTEVVWKFSKVRQSFLLKEWPKRKRVSAATFKLLLGYMRSLPAASAERTATQAKELAAKAEVDEAALLEQRAAAAADAAANGDGDGDGGEPTAEAIEMEERLAVLKIQSARAKKVLQVLGVALEPAPAAEPAPAPAASEPAAASDGFSFGFD